MLFTEKFLEDLKNDPLAGTISIVRNVQDRMNPHAEEWEQSDFDNLIEAYALIVEIAESGLLDIEPPTIEITGTFNNDCSQINTFLTHLEQHCISEASKLKLESLKKHFKTSLGSGFCYEFSQGDLEKLQGLINQLRDLISSSNGLEKDHQRRLLARLEKLQSEMHKKVSDLDRFWGLVGDAGVVMGKLGNDAKPIVDRIKELADIVWRTQSRAEELPSGTQLPMLTNNAGSEET